MPDHGIVCRGVHEGKEVLGMRLSFTKRYITLAPIATVVGLAFKLFDPDKLLGGKEDVGITCALLPHTTPGLEVGRRHYPASNPFQNGPIHGKDIFVPLDYIIGGPKMAGHGWRMLMECLAAGRAVCLPSSGTASAKVAAQTTGAYARLRKQFNMPVGKFEGVEEALTRIAGTAYWTEAAFKFTLGALNSGEKPPVPSAIVKYHLTEAGRQTVSDAMDVQGGKAVMMGPKNYVASGYQGLPIGITVEGANILTRSMIIFGQGAVRCHPYVLQEMRAGQDEDFARGLKAFDKAVFDHISFTLSNMMRSFWMGLTNAKFTAVPVVNKTKRYYQWLNRFSTTFALAADFSMLTLGGDLKRKEKLSARLGDVLSQLYILSAVLRRYADDGFLPEDLPLVRWCGLHGLYEIQEQLDGLLRNLPNRFAAKLLRVLIFPWGKSLRRPTDRLGKRVASTLLTPSATLDRLLTGIYRPRDLQSEKGILHNAFSQVEELAPLEKLIDTAYKKRQIHGLTPAERIQAAANLKIISETDAERLLAFDKLRQHVISVDDFENL